MPRVDGDRQPGFLAAALLPFAEVKRFRTQANDSDRVLWDGYMMERRAEYMHHAALAPAVDAFGSQVGTRCRQQSALSSAFYIESLAI